MAFAILRIGAPFTYEANKSDADLSAIGAAIQNYSQSGEILFMYERQLLTFGMIPRVPLVQEDEVVSLMEMAISGNEPYLEQFYRDLASHRFAAIVAHPQNLGVETGDFIEESDVWNRLVAQPMLCQYKPALTLAYSHVQILVPRARPCPGVPSVDPWTVAGMWNMNDGWCPARDPGPSAQPRRPCVSLAEHENTLHQQRVSSDRCGRGQRQRQSCAPTGQGRQ